MKKTIAIPLATVVLFSGANIALANWGDNVVVVNNNHATVMTEAGAEANTGGNIADGGRVGSAGDGGNVTRADMENTGGDGGNAGSAGDGGVIITGAAVADTLVSTAANTNETTIRGGDDVTVRNNNHVMVLTGAYAAANTGYNDANGGNTGSAGDGGNVRRSFYGNEGGEGGNSGSAGDGGRIVTGDGTAIATVVNDVNRNDTTVIDNCDTCMEPMMHGPFWWFWMGSDDVVVRNNNGAMIMSGAEAMSNTGENIANGGNSGSGGDGGNVTRADMENTGGDGGNAGSAGDGGVIITGDAYAWAAVSTEVNHNTTDVRDNCDICGMWGSNNVTVRNNNGGFVGASSDAYADTGVNDANGGNTGSAGDGGNVRRSFYGNEGGEGGNSGSAGDGGRIVTGVATVYSDAIVVGNRNVTRIRY